MSKPTTSPDMINAISLQALADGGLCAPPRRVARRSTCWTGSCPCQPFAPPAKARRPMMSATFGLNGFLSSPSAALQSSLASRLKRQLDGVGSTLFSLTWKDKATPAGRPYCQLAASARRISDSDYGSWPTPMAGTPARNGNNEAGNNDSSRKPVSLVVASPRATPQSRAGRDRRDERTKAKRWTCQHRPLGQRRERTTGASRMRTAVRSRPGRLLRARVCAARARRTNSIRSAGAVARQATIGRGDVSELGDPNGQREKAPQRIFGGMAVR